MKTRPLIFLAAILLLSFEASVSAAPAKKDQPAPGNSSPAASASPDDLAALDRFLTMSDDELDELEAAVARVRAMSATQRAELREQIRAYRELPPAKRAQVRAGWGWQSDADRDDWRTMMHSKSEAERAAIQAELQALAPAQRTARKLEILTRWREANGRRADAR